MKHKTFSISKRYNIDSDTLFEIVSDFENYYQWNTIIPDAKGKLVVNGELALILKLNNKEKPLKPTVLSMDDKKSFLLSKIIIAKRIGELTHKFDFISLPNNTTQFTQTWTGKGILMQILWSKIERGFSDFNVFNNDLERFVEKRFANKGNRCTNL